MSGYVPKFIKREENKTAGDIVTALEWNTLFNLLIEQGDDTALNLESLYNIIAQNYSNTQDITEMINDKVLAIGAGDMAKSVYDSNNDGVVDKAAALVDNSVTTNNLKNSIVTEVKLASAVQSKLNKIHAAMFKIDYTKATSTTTGTTNSYTTLNKTHFFNLGFTPKAVLIFNYDKQGEDGGTNYVREKAYQYLIFGYSKYYEYSDHDNEEYIDYGGFAVTGAPAVGAMTNLEVFSITTNGINLKEYYYMKDDYSDGSELINKIDLSDSYCIAIG